MTLAHAPYYAWLGAMPAAGAWSAFWVLRRRDQLGPVRKSLWLSTAASIPGALFWVEHMVRLASQEWLGAAHTFGYDYASFLLSCFWLFVGPLPLVGAFVGCRSRPDRPRGAMAFVAVHTGAWALSVFIAVQVGLSV